MFLTSAHGERQVYMTHVQSPPMSPAIYVRGLAKSFKGKLALQDINLSIADGEMVALVGASGSGKSTLLRALNGLHCSDCGLIEVGGMQVQSEGRLHSRVPMVRSRMGFIFQQFNLVNRLTVLENVLIGHLAKTSLIRSFLRQFTQDEKAQALAALETVGILEQAYKRAADLSGGQQQRVAIARCLMQGAQIILADEPIASLDPESARKVMELLTWLNQEQGITIVCSLHQVQMVQRYFNRSVALKDGIIRFDGLTTDLDHERLSQIYGSSLDELVVRGHGEVFVKT